MAKNTPEIVEQATESTKIKKVRPKKSRPVKITVEFDQESINEGLAAMIAKISNLVR